MADLPLHINAVDTLMFRDGRPFNQADAGASEASSVFPPYPPTVAGAVRAALWQQLGGTKDAWEKNKDKLGDGTNWQAGKAVLGPLKFGAPIVVRKEKLEGHPEKYNKTSYFPVPLHIVEGVGERLTRLLPGPERDCDLGGKITLPVAKNEKLMGIKTIEDRWVNFDGMEKILNGDVPAEDDFIKRTDLWRAEPRVGIGINRKSRTTTDGQLYMASHVRMADNVSLYVQLQGWDGDFDKALRPLAGEHRMAQIEAGKLVGLPERTENIEDGRYCVIALSPVVAGKKGAIDGLAETDIVSACLGKPVSIGGWNSQAGKPGPIPLRQCYPAGSVWFMRGETPPPSIGQATEWGFGQILIGTWQERQGT